jgi:hypothetical protein
VGEVNREHCRSITLESLARMCKWYKGPQPLGPSAVRGRFPVGQPIGSETLFLGTTVVRPGTIRQAHLMRLRESIDSSMPIILN